MCNLGLSFFFKLVLMPLWPSGRTQQRQGQGCSLSRFSVQLWAWCPFRYYHLFEKDKICGPTFKGGTTGSKLFCSLPQCPWSFHRCVGSTGITSSADWLPGPIFSNLQLCWTSTVWANVFQVVVSALGSVGESLIITYFKKLILVLPEFKNTPGDVQMRSSGYHTRLAVSAG